jgi:hypothetical protein
LLGASGLRAVGSDCLKRPAAPLAVVLHATVRPALLGHVGEDRRGARDDVAFEDEPADELLGRDLHDRALGRLDSTGSPVLIHSMMAFGRPSCGDGHSPTAFQPCTAYACTRQGLT